MDSARPGNPPIFLTLKQAAQSLAVSVDVLLTWNENNILKPTVTPDGEVGYTKQQIDQFLAIRNSNQISLRENFIQSSSNFSQPPTPQFEKIVQENNYDSHNQSANNFAQVNNYNFYTTPIENSKNNKSFFSTIGIFTGISIFIVIVFVILFSQENKLNEIRSENKTAKIENGKIIAQNSNLEKTDLTNPESKKNTNNENLTNEGDQFSKNKSTALNNAFEEKEVSASAQKNDQDKLAVLKSILGTNSSEDIKSGLRQDADVNTYAQKANFNTSSSCPDCDTESTVFDTEGNIKVSKEESEENKLLATSMSMGGFNQTQSLVKQTSSSVTLISFIILGLFSLYVLYSGKKQLFPYSSTSENLSLQTIHQSQIQTKILPRLMEIHQKTDGTVALFLQGKEFKISKPELDSESDKFIERLMQLTSNNVKEIEYDAQIDNLNINTPLSKLVTRLGFVGIKRELFFPRTSKTQVYFRKYLTAEDLMGMNLTIDDVKAGFLPLN